MVGLLKGDLMKTSWIKVVLHVAVLAIGEIINVLENDDE